MAEMKQEPLETQINGLIVAEDMEPVNHQVVIKNEEDQEVKVKEETEPHQRIKTLAEIKVEIPPDSTPFSCSNSRPFCCSDCGRSFTKESQLQRHKCFVRQESVCSNVQSKKTPTPIVQSTEALLSEDHPPSVTGQNPFHCSVSKKSFLWASHLPVNHQVVMKNEIKDEENQEGEVKEEIEPHQRIETWAEIEVEIPPDFTPICCSDCGRDFTKKSQLQCHKCFVCKENAGSNVKSKKTPLSKNPPPSATVQKPFRCPVCKKSFQWESSMQIHMRVHTGIDVCKFCRKKFHKKSEYQKHLLKHKEKKSLKSKVGKKKFSSKAFPCPLCELGFDQEKSLIRHQKRVHHACPICLKQCANLSSVTNHESRHYRADGTLDQTHRPKPFSCSYCEKSFALQTMLIRHREKSHNIGPFICSECGKHVMTAPSLSRHEAEHKGYKCSDCNDCFPTRRKLKSHMKTHKKSFVCSVCEKTFHQEHGLTKHMESHVEEKPFNCSLCEKSFVSQRELLQHQKIKHHMCPLCSEKFSDIYRVNEHFNSHPWPEVEAYRRPFQCSECGLRLLSVHTLLQHQIVHSEETPVECPVCEMRFKTTDNLQYHHKRKHDPTPFPCSLCEKRFKTKMGLIIHMRLCRNHLATENQEESTPSTSENCVSGE